VFSSLLFILISKLAPLLTSNPDSINTSSLDFKIILAGASIITLPKGIQEVYLIL